MKKPTTLIARTLVNHGGKSYAAGMQFTATEKEAAELVRSGEAVEATPEAVEAAQRPEADAKPTKR